jgi:hypothetical protein
MYFQVKYILKRNRYYPLKHPLNLKTTHTASFHKIESRSPNQIKMSMDLNTQQKNSLPMNWSWAIVREYDCRHRHAKLALREHALGNVSLSLCASILWEHVGHA